MSIRHHPSSFLVAPRVGAWIEISSSGANPSSSPSLPAWERGLKSSCFYLNCFYIQVAPRVGAWIEIPTSGGATTHRQVAPRVGAWIEMPVSYGLNNYFTRRSPRGSVD